ncbi:hypothetical protein [Paenibacillus larvae]|uniref:Uncharacterized protein n=1 Tax=Paenibacillus larvae subsp. larvae TaxID=147375 RepID=A0A6C0QZP4_9BACL|nr:hypothetical protein [Paenibacillus larvae]QHZ54152.1 hypothetical protein ERICV_05168 [Paenibacillus larvae subsp. larvae]
MVTSFLVVSGKEKAGLLARFILKNQVTTLGSLQARFPDVLFPDGEQPKVFDLSSRDSFPVMKGDVLELEVWVQNDLYFIPVHAVLEKKSLTNTFGWTYQLSKIRMRVSINDINYLIL